MMRSKAVSYSGFVGSVLLVVVLVLVLVVSLVVDVVTEVWVVSVDVADVS
jgi:hypothetical protein